KEQKKIKQFVKARNYVGVLREFQASLLPLIEESNSMEEKRKLMLHCLNITSEYATPAPLLAILQIFKKKNLPISPLHYNTVMKRLLTKKNFPDLLNLYKEMQSLDYFKMDVANCNTMINALM